jgi:membrane-bound ClpP family serine protease
MIETLIIVGLIILIIGIICLFAGLKGWDFLFGVIGAYMLSGGIMMYEESHKPTAIDVYQGKTTLEYTIKDGVVTDSVVVFKDKEK